MSINRVILSGTAGQFGVKISWTQSGKPQTSFSLVIEEPGREGSTFKTFVPVLIIGAQAESLAETLKPRDLVSREGRLSYKAGRRRRRASWWDHIGCRTPVASGRRRGSRGSGRLRCGL